MIHHCTIYMDMKIDKDYKALQCSKMISAEQFFLLDIFFIYISNAFLKVPYTLTPPCSPTHPLPLPGPGIPLYWGT